MNSLSDRLMSAAQKAQLTGPEYSRLLQVVRANAGMESRRDLHSAQTKFAAKWSGSIAGKSLASELRKQNAVVQTTTISALYPNGHPIRGYADNDCGHRN